MKRLLLFLPLLVACPSGPTTAEAINAYKADMETIRANLLSAAGKIPAHKGPFPECSGDRGFVYAQKEKTNFDIVAIEALPVPRAKPEPVDYMLSDKIERCLYWVAPGSQPLPDPDQGSAIKRAFENCKKITHVLLTKNTAHARDKGLLETTFYLAEVAKGGIECQFKISASADASSGIVRFDLVDTTTNKAVRPTQSRDEYANLLWLDARRKLTPALAQHLGLVADLKR